MSEYTKNVKRKLILFRILDALCLTAPMLIYFVIALMDDGVGVVSKFSCTGLFIVALILSLFNILTAKRLTCVKWIMVLGLTIAIHKYLLPLFVIMAIVTVLDDFLFQSIIQHYKMQLESSRVIDDRFGTVTDTKTQKE